MARSAVPRRRGARRQQQRVRRGLQVGHVPEGQRLVGRERRAVLALGKPHQRAAAARRVRRVGRQPTAFSALRTFTPVAGPGGTNAVTPGSVGNADLRPERGKETELGFETGSLQSSERRLHVLQQDARTTRSSSSRRAVDRLLRQRSSSTSARSTNNGIELEARLQAIDAT